MIVISHVLAVISGGIILAFRSSNVEYHLLSYCHILWFIVIINHSIAVGICRWAIIYQKCVCAQTLANPLSMPVLLIVATDESVEPSLNSPAAKQEASASSHNRST